MTSRGAVGATTRIIPPDPTWTRPELPDPGHVETLASELRLPRAVCAVLVARGLSSPDEAKRFLRPRLEHLHDPAVLVMDEEEAARISLALLMMVPTSEGRMKHPLSAAAASRRSRGNHGNLDGA